MNLQGKIIGILIAIILMLGLVFQSFRLNVSKEKQKSLQTQIIALNEQNSKNMQDLENRNQEVIKNKGEIYELQNKIKKQFSSDSCVNTTIDNSFIELLQNSNN